MCIPDKIGKYKILEKIGEGASGCVLKARQEIINRIVAIKVLYSSILYQNPIILKRFKREAKLAASLIHPNIVPIFEIGEEDKLYYYTMQYIKGISLKKIIEEKKEIDILKKVNIFIEICDALSLAHSKNIIHRDLKPHNIIITDDLHPILLDFGIAKSLTDNENMTKAGHILGSAHYMAPEQAKGSNIGSYSDIFALGVIFYEFLVYKRPFSGEGIKDILLKRINYLKEPDKFKPKSLREINKDIPYKLEEIVFKCLKPHPNERYFNAQDLLKDLKDYKKELKYNLFLKQNKKIIKIIKIKNFLTIFIIYIIIISLITIFSIWIYLKKDEKKCLIKNIQIEGYKIIKTYFKKK